MGQCLVAGGRLMEMLSEPTDMTQHQHTEDAQKMSAPCTSLLSSTCSDMKTDQKRGPIRHTPHTSSQPTGCSETRQGRGGGAGNTARATRGQGQPGSVPQLRLRELRRARQLRGPGLLAARSHPLLRAGQAPRSRRPGSAHMACCPHSQGPSARSRPGAGTPGIPTRRPRGRGVARHAGKAGQRPPPHGSSTTPW